MIARSEFDTKNTLLYKWANLLNSPVRYIYPLPNSTYSSVVNFISERIPKKTIDSTYLALKEAGSDVDIKDFTNIFIIILKIKQPQLNDQQITKGVNDFYLRTGVEIQPLKDTDIEGNTRIFREQFEKSLKIDKEKFEYYNYLENTLTSITPLASTPPVISAAILYFTPAWSNGDRIDARDGMDIFSEMVSSAEIPFIQYNNGKGESFIWLYQGSPSVGDAPDFDLVTQSSTQTNVIILTISSLAKIEKGTILSKDSYVKVIYNLETGNLVVPSPTADEGIARMRQRITSAFPMLSLNEGKETRIKGYFEVEKVVIDDTILHYLLLNHPLYNAYLSVDESDHSRAEKSRINIHYRPPDREVSEYGTPSVVTVTLGPMDEEDDLFPEIGGKGFFDPATPTTNLRINVVKAESTEILDQFIRIFSRLLSLYKQLAPAVNEQYANYIHRNPITTQPISTPGVVTAGSLTTPTVEGGKAFTHNKSKNKNLVNRFPDIFTKGYARECQCKHQPIIIKPDEIADWENKMFVNPSGGLGDTLLQKREVVTFPSPTREPLFYFVCPQNKYPYPNIKGISFVGKSAGKSMDKSGAEKLLPCCTATPNDIGMKINAYYQARSDPSILASLNKSTVKNDYRIITTKYVAPGREANLPRVFIDLLSGTTENRVKDFVRVGVPVGANSLIHCVMVAIQDPYYLSLPTNEAKEAHVSAFRKHDLSKSIPQIVQQELFDWSIEEIQTRISDTKLFFDPYLFYRILEVRLGVNIFVFNMGSVFNPIKGINDTETEASMEIPRCKISHIRPYRNRKSIIILKHYNKDSGITEYPHCELIAFKGTDYTLSENTDDDDDSDDSGERKCGRSCFTPSVSGGSASGETETTYILPENVTRFLYEILYQTMNEKVWSFNEGDNIEARSQPFSRINWEELVDMKTVVGQKIDSNGKLRILGIRVRVRSGKEWTMCLYTLPSQPLNVPEIENFDPVPFEVATQVLGPATSQNESGAWFRMLDYPEAIYVPLSTRPPPGLKDGPPAPYQITKDYDFRVDLHRMKKSKLSADILLQLVMWLWRLSGSEPFSEWFSKHVIVDNNMEEKAKTSTFNTVKSRLPVANSTETGLRALYRNKVWPEFFRETKIHLYSKLAEKIYYYFLRQEVESEGLNTPPSFYLEGLYESNFDFKIKPRNLLFTNVNHMKSWLASQNSRLTTSSVVNVIQTSLSSENAFNIEPYLYLNKKTSKVYIVQNVRDTSLERVFTVLSTWKESKTNSGYESYPSDMTNIPGYVVYGISKENDLIPIYNSSRPGEEYFEIICYLPKYEMIGGVFALQGGSFGALIPIL
jgi:hypothetical protein